MTTSVAPITNHGQRFIAHSIVAIVQVGAQKVALFFESFWSRPVLNFISKTTFGFRSDSVRLGLTEKQPVYLPFYAM